VTVPSVTIQALHVSDGINLPVVRVVVHATSPGPNVAGTLASAAGMATGTARYFQRRTAGGSAHYVIDIGGEEVCVAEDRIAQHAPPNQNSIGIEICGQSYYTREQWLSPHVLPAVERAARRARDVCDRHSIPWRRLTVEQVKAGEKGVCSHADVSEAFKLTDHTDPGPDFPFDWFMAAGAPVPLPVLSEEDDMQPVVDTKVPPLKGLIPHWTSNEKGEMFAWNGARGLRNVGDFDPGHAPIARMVADPSGDGVILIADNGHAEPDGAGGTRYVQSTWTILVGM
jgi:hypothetical protein